MLQLELETKFHHITPNEGQSARCAEIRQAALDFATLINNMAPPNSFETQEAIRHVKAASMWATESIAINEPIGS